jgi:hypothetical protein
MIRTDAQTCRALRVLLARVDLGDLWTSEGPTDRAVELLEAGGEPLPPVDRAIFLAAWGIWNRGGELPFADVVRLDAGHLEALCSLLVALTRDGVTVEAWIENPEARCVRSPGGHCSRPACTGPENQGAAPREHSDRPGCMCPCEDCASARLVEDRVARRATRETTRIRR